MGMNYQLHCQDCVEGSQNVEFSIVDFVQLKFPDDADHDLTTWAEFLVKHSGHRIHFIDEYGKETNPAKINGPYVLGITKEP